VFCASCIMHACTHRARGGRAAAAAVHRVHPRGHRAPCTVGRRHRPMVHTVHGWTHAPRRARSPLHAARQLGRQAAPAHVMAAGRSSHQKAEGGPQGGCETISSAVLSSPDLHVCIPVTTSRHEVRAGSIKAAESDHAAAALGPPPRRARCILDLVLVHR
jgi:hypothetical protein